MAAERIIFVINYNKNYLLNFVQNTCQKCESFFLFFGYPDEIQNRRVFELGRVLFWKDFRDAQSLVDQISPNKVVFFELETLNQIALNAICKEQGIQTEYCDHGYQDFKTSEIASQFSKAKTPVKFYRFFKSVLLRGILGVVRNRNFFSNSLKRSGDENCKIFMKRYKEVRLSRTILETRKSISSQYANPDGLICFSPSNKNFYDRLFNNDSIPVTFTGYPEFDELNKFLPNCRTKVRKALFIDQPYVDRRLYGWTRDLKLNFLNYMVHFCKEHGYELLIKPHPREVSFWANVSGFELVEEGRFLEVISNISVVFGYNSTLLFPFATNPFVNVFILNNHPSGNQVSNFLVVRGVAKWFREEELEELKVGEKMVSQDVIEELQYKADGAASKRLTVALLA